MERESNKPINPEHQPAIPDFIVTNTKDYSVGISREFPTIKPESVIDLIHQVNEKEPDNLGGYRDKNKVLLKLNDGFHLPVMVKAKFTTMANAYDSHRVNKEWQRDYDNYDEFKKRHEAIPELLFNDGPFSRKHLKMMYQEARLSDSVINEAMICKTAQKRYQQKYHEELPIEQSLGFVVDKTGHKWVLYKFINDLIDESSLSSTQQDIIEKIKYEASIKYTDRLHAIGIFPGDIDMKNIGIIGDLNDMENVKPILLDTEEWYDSSKYKLR